MFDYSKNTSNMPPPLESDAAPNNYSYTPESIVALSSGYHQHPVTQGELDAHGGYVFAHPGTHPSYAAALHCEPVSLMRRPTEDVYCMAPQAPSNGAHTCPDIHNMRTGPYECRRGLSPTHGHPPTIPYMPQRDAASHDPPSSVPRACWPPTTGPAYTPPAPVPAPSVSEAYFFWPSAFDTSQGGHHHEAPTPWDRIGSCTLPEVPPPMQFSAPPLAQSYPTPEYAGAGAPCEGFGMMDMPFSDFQPGQHQEPGWTDSSLRTRSDYQQSRRLRCEESNPFVHQTTRSGHKVRQTLKANIGRTQANDLGNEDVTGLSAQRYLPMPPRGPSTPPPATSARGKKGGAKARGKTQDPRPAPAKRTRRKIPPPPGMPKVEKVGDNRYGCPHEGCSKDYSRAYDVKRHYWDHVDDKLIWICMECFGVYTRYDNALKHFKLAHKREALDEDILMIQCTTEQIALWGV
ncbi:hypothetical protein EVG20_g7260 [Dentipellis fragilis]|uniref:C2H2-type domain-containing protein n=1 Tax=Dentipellis fragilis TaxID=205917 RepID=A0A4Y9YGN5_9AGAM|nr:hypothetical protein EVG20_g7260 [Dentipellis fragilis]